MFTSANSSFASPSCRAGWPPTSTQLLMISRSSSSLEGGRPFSPSWSESSKERAGGSNLIRRPRQMMPIKIGSKKKKEKLNYYIFFELPVSLSPSSSPSGSSSFSFNWPTIRSKCARFAARKTSYQKQMGRKQR